MVTTTVFTPTVSATLNGVAIAGVRKARVISSFSDPVSRLYVSAYPAIDWTDGDTLTVTMGSGSNNVLSGTGQVWQADYMNAGPTFELVGRGPLFKAQKYRNNVTGGLTLTDLTGGPATDEVIAQAVLTIAGVTFTPANIGGTGLVRGTLAPTAYTWRQGETALDYLQRLTKASLGYRMVETIGGDVLRIKVVGRPVSTPAFTLSQGVDILTGGHTQADAFTKYSAVTVSGYDFGDGNGAVTFSNPNPVPVGVDTFTYSSDMIERAQENDPGAGVSCANVARNFVEPEVERTTLRVSGIKTPRDDLFEPGQTHQIDAAWLGLSNQLLWCMSVTRECDDKWFTQTLEYLGGGPVADPPFPDGRVPTFRLDLAPRAPRRLKDYTYVYQAQLPNLAGSDFMVPGDQSFPDSRRRALVPQQPAQDRSHAGIFGALTPP